MNSPGRLGHPESFADRSYPRPVMCHFRTNRVKLTYVWNKKEHYIRMDKPSRTSYSLTALNL
ncbi:hypothetical protein [Paenibacillus puerhi]|uniref:hypothetical protein n=1 Tax=Paenibacillus puerhi TaxID=2692622 RepID=UPI00135CCD4F|nr:hypothetical protein [Paenibacillus puerhi]